MTYKSYITDLHVNIHPDQMALMGKWYEHSKDVLDFYTLAYYPYEQKVFPGGMKSEGMIDTNYMEQQWQELNAFFSQQAEHSPGYLSFLGYEWQGSGKDGDHNVYFKDKGPIKHPLRYEDLITELKQYPAIGIPHHLAYSLGHRGKNWETHNDAFSPFAEIYSSHGSSESADTDLPMTRHIHMGPRTGGTSVVDGLKKGKHVGIIASGDNHVVPGMVNHGRAGVWASDYSKEAIWEAFNTRRVYGFTNNKIETWMTLDEQPMGTIVKKNDTPHEIAVNVIANNRIDRIELIKDGEIEDVLTNTQNKVNSLKPDDTVTFKFKLECGWGPDLNVYPDLMDKLWTGHLSTTGKIISVEKDYNSFGNTYDLLNDQRVDFSCTSHKTTQSGFWMGPSPVNTEGFIFEIEAPLNSEIIIKLNGKSSTYTVKSILENTELIVFYEESKQLAAERFQFENYYRSDAFYHNAFKARVNKGALNADYQLSHTFPIQETPNNSFYYIKVHQKDGQVAWTSPVWLED